MRDVMIDLETLGTAPGSAIVSLGAVFFDSWQVSDTRRYYGVVDLQSCLRAGLKIDAQTLAWWMRQSPEAREVFDRPGEPLAVVLDGFARWLAEGSGIATGIRVWGNGASFDLSLLAAAYRAMDLPLPWEFWNERCYRTAAAIGRDGGKIKRVQSGVHHNALDDAVSQADHLVRLGLIGR